MKLNEADKLLTELIKMKEIYDTFSKNYWDITSNKMSELQKYILNNISYKKGQEELYIELKNNCYIDTNCDEEKFIFIVDNYKQDRLEIPITYIVKKIESKELKLEHIYSDEFLTA